MYFLVIFIQSTFLVRILQSMSILLPMEQSCHCYKVYHACSPHCDDCFVLVKVYGSFNNNMRIIMLVSVPGQRSACFLCVSTDNASSICFAEAVICCKYRWLQSIINPEVRFSWLSVDAKNVVEESCWSLWLVCKINILTIQWGTFMSLLWCIEFVHLSRMCLLCQQHHYFSL